MRVNGWLLSLLLVAALGVLVGGESLAEPVIMVGTQQGFWRNQITLDADYGQAQTFHVYLGSDWEDEGAEVTYNFAGPAGDGDYAVTYSVGGEVEVPNEFEVTLAEGAVELVRVVIEAIDAPRRFLFAEFSLAAQGAGGATALARINLVVPGDVMVRAQEELTWAGQDWFASVLRPWTGEDVPSVVTRWKAPYSVRLVNAENATVSYDLRMQNLGDNGLIARYFLGEHEVTGAITSEAGYRTPFLTPGEQLTLTAELMPVGSDIYLREVSCGAAVAEVQLPPLWLGTILDNLSPFAMHVEDVPEEVGTTFTLYDGDQWAPGNFGLMDFDAGSNPTPPLRDWILNGYDLSIEKDTEFVWIYGSPGWRQALLSEVQEQIDAQAHMRAVVYDQSRGPGDGAEVRMIAVLDYVPIDASDHQITARYLGCSTLLESMAVTSFDAVNFGAMPKWRVRIEGWQELEEGPAMESNEQ